mmetsp:Transcript_39931/g.81777  ORF Transcript_39931/g.81777 Transcript_39931/m.81777 type:complete len:168 (+) Transcript_39931:38-541(+)
MMMRRVFSNGMKRAYSSSGRSLAEPVAATSTEFVINFCTPHVPVHNNKVVESVVLPGCSGEYGISHGHSPLISQLEPGVVTVNHVGGATEKYFVPGGFAITKADSVTDISVPEAVLLEDLDESAVREAFNSASSLNNSSAEGSTDKATSTIQMEVARAMSRAMGFTL